MSGPSGRVSGAWYNATSFNVDVNLTDGNTHQVALYFTDYDYGNRTETIQVLDSQSGTQLDTETLTSFTGGQYLVWTISGHVVFKFTHVAGPNAVLSGLFFGTGGQESASAQFVRNDAATAGSWAGVYGSHGSGIDAVGLYFPEFATVGFQGELQWIWAASTTDPRALQISAMSTARIASTWYAGTDFTISVNISDAVVHPVAIYCVDWDNRGRVQTIDILNAQTGQVLDTRTLSNFTGGQYLVWNITGNVIIRATDNTSPNAVISGIFF